MRNKLVTGWSGPGQGQDGVGQVTGWSGQSQDGVGQSFTRDDGICEI